MGILHEDIRTFIISHSILLRMTNVSQNSCRKKNQTPFYIQ